MNTVVTSREAILKASCELADGQGLQALNMRDVAALCGVSVGSVYNYFPSKAELVAATIQEIWQVIFAFDSGEWQGSSFADYVGWLYERVRSGTSQHPNFFAAHSINVAIADRGVARKVMGQYFDRVHKGLLGALHSDRGISSTAFDESFTEQMFVEFVLASLLNLMRGQQGSSAALVEVIRRTIYR